MVLETELKTKLTSGGGQRGQMAIEALKGKGKGKDRKVRFKKRS